MNQHTKDLCDRLISGEAKSIHVTIKDFGEVLTYIRQHGVSVDFEPTIGVGEVAICLDGGLSAAIERLEQFIESAEALSETWHPGLSEGYPFKHSFDEWISEYLVPWRDKLCAMRVSRMAQ